MASEVESLETTSSSLSEDSLNISFDNISYTVRNGLLAGGIAEVYLLVPMTHILQINYYSN